MDRFAEHVADLVAGERHRCSERRQCSGRRRVAEQVDRVVLGTGQSEALGQAGVLPGRHAAGTGDQDRLAERLGPRDLGIERDGLRQQRRGEDPTQLGLPRPAERFARRQRQQDAAHANRTALLLHRIDDPQEVRHGLERERFGPQHQDHFVADTDELPKLVAANHRRTVEKERVVAGERSRVVQQDQEFFEGVRRSAGLAVRGREVEARNNVPPQGRVAVRADLPQRHAGPRLTHAEGDAGAAQRIAVNDQNLAAGQGRGSGQVDDGRRFANAAFLTGDKELFHTNTPSGNRPASTEQRGRRHFRLRRSHEVMIMHKRGGSNKENCWRKPGDFRGLFRIIAPCRNGGPGVGLIAPVLAVIRSLQPPQPRFRALPEHPIKPGGRFRPIRTDDPVCSGSGRESSGAEP